MSRNPIIAQKPASTIMIADQFSADLPQCPAGCGALAFSRRAKGGKVWCLACGWHVLLLPDEARDLSAAIAGLDPDLHLDLFIQHVALRQSRALAARRAAARTWKEIRATAGWLALFWLSPQALIHNPAGWCFFWWHIRPWQRTGRLRSLAALCRQQADSASAA